MPKFKTDLRILRADRPIRGIPLLQPTHGPECVLAAGIARQAGSGATSPYALSGRFSLIGTVPWAGLSIPCSIRGPPSLPPYGEPGARLGRGYYPPLQEVGAQFFAALGA